MRRRYCWLETRSGRLIICPPSKRSAAAMLSCNMGKVQACSAGAIYLAWEAPPSGLRDELGD
jgi:hypothetical protein